MGLGLPINNGRPSRQHTICNLLIREFSNLLINGPVRLTELYRFSIMCYNAANNGLDNRISS